MKFALERARSGHPQRAANLDRGDRAVRHPALAAAPVLADIVDGGRRHRVLPDDDEFQRDDDGAGRRRRGPHVRARVHDAVLDAAHRVARAARAREGKPVDRGRRSRSPGSTLVVEPWNWRGDLAPKLWAVLSGFGWAAGTVATKYFQRGRKLDPLNFVAWQMLAGVMPLTLPAVAARHRRRRSGARRTRCCCSTSARCRPASAFLLWIDDPAYPAGRHRVAQHVRDSGDRARELDARVRRTAHVRGVGGHRVHRRRPCDHLGQCAARAAATWRRRTAPLEGG